MSCLACAHGLLSLSKRFELFLDNNVKPLERDVYLYDQVTGNRVGIYKKYLGVKLLKKFKLINFCRDRFRGDFMVEYKFKGEKRYKIFNDASFQEVVDYFTDLDDDHIGSRISRPIIGVSVQMDDDEYQRLNEIKPLLQSFHDEDRLSDIVKYSRTLTNKTQSGLESYNTQSNGEFRKIKLTYIRSEKEFDRTARLKDIYST